MLAISINVKADQRQGNRDVLTHQIYVTYKNCVQLIIITTMRQHLLFSKGFVWVTHEGVPLLNIEPSIQLQVSSMDPPVPDAATVEPHKADVEWKPWGEQKQEGPKLGLQLWNRWLRGSSDGSLKGYYIEQQTLYVLLWMQLKLILVILTTVSFEFPQQQIKFFIYFVSLLWWLDLPFG